MKTYKVLVVGIVLAGILLMLQAPPIIFAQGPPPPQDQGPPPQQGPGQDPPGRVARLSFSNGSVSFQPGGEGDWVQAVPNRPLTTGDNLWADKDSRAELQTGSTSIRMDSETSVTFLDLDDRTTQLKLSQGSIIVRVRHLDDEDQFEIDTPNLAFQIQRTGDYRIDVSADGNETDATVWHGRAEATGGGASYTGGRWPARKLYWHRSTGSRDCPDTESPTISIIFPPSAINAKTTPSLRITFLPK